jgi:hypothetical protein
MLYVEQYAISRLDGEKAHSVRPKTGISPAEGENSSQADYAA